MFVEIAVTTYVWSVIPKAKVSKLGKGISDRYTLYKEFSFAKAQYQVDRAWWACLRNWQK